MYMYVCNCVCSEKKIGIFSSDTRTSTNAWVKRSTNLFTDSISRRAADLLHLPESQLHPHMNCEDLQVLSYSVGQKYDAHHDWGVNGRGESRFATLLFYLNDVDSELDMASSSVSSSVSSVSSVLSGLNITGKGRERGRGRGRGNEEYTAGGETSFPKGVFGNGDEYNNNNNNNKITDSLPHSLPS